MTQDGQQANRTNSSCLTTQTILSSNSGFFLEKKIDSVSGEVKQVLLSDSYK